jgi:hypothetical protein
MILLDSSKLRIEHGNRKTENAPQFSTRFLKVSSGGFSSERRTPGSHGLDGLVRLVLVVWI